MKRIKITLIIPIIAIISCQSKIDINEQENLVKNKIDNKCCESASNRSKFIINHTTNDTLESIPIALKSLSNTKSNDMVIIEKGVFLMGASDQNGALNREYPKHKVKVNSFLIDIHEVTNSQFKKFVDETGYVTTAEKRIEWEVLKKQLPRNTPKPSEEVFEPGSLVFSTPKKINNLIDFSQWWKWVKGANWKQPKGPNSSITGIENHPVVHISFKDATEYSKWCGKRLPTEAEWEWAARGGLKNCIYPWGNEHIENGESKCNFWSGDFPLKNNKKDGYILTAPVMKYPPNNYGLYDMAGNVWEICSDWYDGNYYNLLSKNEISNNPRGPKTWNYPREPYDPKKVVRGGSFLCNDSYCASYRVSARMPYSIDTGMSHTGFRCVKDI